MRCLLHVPKQNRLVDDGDDLRRPLSPDCRVLPLFGGVWLALVAQLVAVQGNLRDLLGLRVVLARFLCLKTLLEEALGALRLLALFFDQAIERGALSQVKRRRSIPFLSRVTMRPAGMVLW